MRKMFKIMVALLVVLVLSLTVSAKTKSEASVELSSGPIELQLVPTISFGSQKIKARATEYPAKEIKDSVIVMDARGTMSGWAIRGSLSSFDHGGTGSLQGASIILSPPAPEPVGSKGKIPSGHPAQVELVSGDQVNHTIWSAKQLEGSGKWSMPLTNDTVTLKVASGNLEVGGHSAQIEWTLIDAPAA